MASEEYVLVWNIRSFQAQIRAILRASAFGNIKVMFPMITDIGELKKIKELFDICRNELRTKRKRLGEESRLE